MGARLSPGFLRTDASSPYRRLVGVGGIGTGLFFALEGDHDLGRNESRPARLKGVCDYCKLHIVAHYPTVLLGAGFEVVPVGKVGADGQAEQESRLVGQGDHHPAIDVGDGEERLGIGVELVCYRA